MRLRSYESPAVTTIIVWNAYSIEIKKTFEKEIKEWRKTDLKSFQRQTESCIQSKETIKWISDSHEYDWLQKRIWMTARFIYIFHAVMQKVSDKNQGWRGCYDFSEPWFKIEIDI